MESLLFLHHFHSTLIEVSSTWSILGNLLRVVVVLFWQHDDQFKSKLPWMEIYINHWLPSNGKVSNGCVRGFGDQAMSSEVRGIGS